jgi:small subunit ribosomal protein S6
MCCSDGRVTSEVKPKEECVRERIRAYELMLIISPIYADDDGVTDIVNRVQQAVESQGGEILSVNHNAPWGRRKLAYPIRAYAGGESSRRIFTEGFYVLMHMTMLSSKVGEMERFLKLTDPVLRYMFTVLESKSDVPGFAADAEEDSEADDETDDEAHDDEGDEAIEEQDNEDAELVEEDAQ